MEEILVSVIMPVYMVEDYVGRAIESIQKQTLTNWEFLIVDDGSPDNSGSICDQYAAKDSRIHVIHKENGGAPSARNVAIDISKGKYLYFMDSDDWTEPTMLQDMVELAEQHQLQLVVAGFYIDTYYTETKKYRQKQRMEDVVFTSQQEFRQNAHRLFDRNLLYTPWNKLFLAQYIKDNRLYFPQTFWDDFPFNVSLVRDVERVGVTSRLYYHFVRKRAESETAKYRSDMYDKREEEHGWMVELYQHWGIDNEDSREFIARRYVERLVGCVENVANRNCSLSPKEKKEQIREMITAPHAVSLMKVAKPQSLYMRMMLLPLRMRCSFLTYWEGKLISRVKSGNIRLFAKLKANR